MTEQALSWFLIWNILPQTGEAMDTHNMFGALGRQQHCKATWSHKLSPEICLIVDKEVWKNILCTSEVFQALFPTTGQTAGEADDMFAAAGDQSDEWIRAYKPSETVSDVLFQILLTNKKGGKGINKDCWLLQVVNRYIKHSIQNF